MNKSINFHLSKEEIIKNGSIFTKTALVELVYNQVVKFIDKNTIIGDFGAGYGAFIDKFQNIGKECFGTEIDDKSYELLKSNFPNVRFYHENSLLNVSRKKYNLGKNTLIVIGNPPYNDVTSIFKKGNKGSLICDEDLHSRDFGISFLKAYDKLNAKYICVLHPLAYLIKKQNFNSLGSFRNNYKLISGVVFSSKEFESIKKSYSDFPVVSALYKRDISGMTFEYIKKFNFNIFNSTKIFSLNKILTIDGIVNKYPNKNNIHGLQFYTLRDMNALMRNASFVENKRINGVEIKDDNLYQYAWLFFLKKNFNPKKNKFLYGNLSPLYTDKINDINFKKALIYYAYNNSELVKKYYSIKKIKSLYGKSKVQYNILFKEIEKLSKMFD